jgi:putative protease
MRKIELLAPAGDMEKLVSAIDFGADAVYLGGDQFGLRSQAGNFDLAALRQAKELCGQRGRRLYLTLNAYLQTAEFPSLEAWLEELRPLDLDAYIIADPGVLATVKQVDPDRELHLSTQANTSNAAAVRFWGDAGVRRVNLARELSLEDIRQISASTDLELEVFVHGAMCVALSGRCLISSAMVGRSANRGNCAQSCRWSWRLEEEQRPGEYFPVEEDSRGTYLFNSRDLRLVEHLPALLGAGVDSLKIEGRMKSRYYVAAVTRVYRAALDAWQSDPEGWVCDPLWLQELDKISHRPYDTGFLFPRQDPAVQSESTQFLRSGEFVAVVLESGADGRCLVQGRNRFLVGEELELIGPQMRQALFTVEQLQSEDGEAKPAAHAGHRVWMDLPHWARPGDLLRCPSRTG